MIYSIAVLLLLLMPSAPKIQLVDAFSIEKLRVTFDPGAVWACTVFRMTQPTEKVGPNEVFPDGHYAPRKCGWIEDTETAYTEDWNLILRYDADWDVYAEVGYPQKGEIVYFTSNKVRVHR